MPPSIIPGPNDTSSQPDWMRWLQQVFPQLAPQQTGAFTSQGRTSASGAPGGWVPPWVQAGAQQGVNMLGRPSLQTSSTGGSQQNPTSREEAMLMEFINELRAPLDFNNPMVSAILRQSQSATEREAQNRGIQGGLALSGQQQAYINAAAQLDAARQQQLGSLLNAGANRALQKDDMNYSRFLQQQERNMDPWRTAGSVYGGLLGAGAGTVASIATGGAALPLVPGLISGGSQLGAGLGGAAYNAFNPQQYQPRRAYSSSTPRLF